MASLNRCLVIVGDTKTPEESYSKEWLRSARGGAAASGGGGGDGGGGNDDAVVFLGVAQQKELARRGSALAESLPWAHFSRKNLGWVALAHCIALRCIALRCVALYCIALRCIALRCIALRCIALNCIALHCVALHCIALHCIALRCVASRRAAPRARAGQGRAREGHASNPTTLFRVSAPAARRRTACPPCASFRPRALHTAPKHATRTRARVRTHSDTRGKDL